MTQVTPSSTDKYDFLCLPSPRINNSLGLEKFYKIINYAMRISSAIHETNLKMVALNLDILHRRKYASPASLLAP